MLQCWCQTLGGAEVDKTPLWLLFSEKVEEVQDYLEFVKISLAFYASELQAAKWGVPQWPFASTLAPNFQVRGLPCHWPFIRFPFPQCSCTCYTLSWMEGFPSDLSHWAVHFYLTRDLQFCRLSVLSTCLGRKHIWSWVHFKRHALRGESTTQRSYLVFATILSDTCKGLFWYLLWNQPKDQKS